MVVRNIMEPTDSNLSQNWSGGQSRERCRSLEILFLRRSLDRVTRRGERAESGRSTEHLDGHPFPQHLNQNERLIEKTRKGGQKMQVVTLILILLSKLPSSCFVYDTQFTKQKQNETKQTKQKCYTESHGRLCQQQVFD